MNPVFLRIRVLSHPRLQFRIAGVFIIWFLGFLLGTAVIGFGIYSNATTLSGSSGITDRGFAENLLSEHFQEFLLSFGGIVAIVSLCLWMYLSAYLHRVTGPVAKLENFLEKCVHNQMLPSEAFRLRKSDAFPGLDEALNTFVESQRKLHPTRALNSQKTESMDERVPAQFH